jgi:hypothetical protein
MHEKSAVEIMVEEHYAEKRFGEHTTSIFRIAD